MKTRIVIALTLFSFSAEAKPVTVALANLEMLRKINAAIMIEDPSLKIGVAALNATQLEKLSLLNHEAGKCGGYEALPTIDPTRMGVRSALSAELAKLQKQVGRDRDWSNHAVKKLDFAKRSDIEEAIKELEVDNLRNTVEWLANFPNRDNRSSNPNVHVNQLEGRLKNMLVNFSGAWSVEQITHSSTRQNSLRVRLTGKTRPNEIVVLGGHLDSISFNSRAPGADDNASGSANLMEALRVLITKGQPERSVEFFWYAGEESGLLGSAEIARSYKAANKDVVAVLQLDMTLFPGAGEFVIGNVGDFTSAWLRDYLVFLNNSYLGARLIEDECGYACSDHASWYRQGYPTLMPFESDTGRMNKKIHTPNDLPNNTVSYRHSLEFSKIALAFAMDLGNSTARQPY